MVVRLEVALPPFLEYEGGCFGSFQKKIVGDVVRDRAVGESMLMEICELEAMLP